MKLNRKNESEISIYITINKRTFFQIWNKIYKMEFHNRLAFLNGDILCLVVN